MNTTTEVKEVSNQEETEALFKSLKSRLINFDKEYRRLKSKIKFMAYITFLFGFMSGAFFVFIANEVLK